MDTSYLKPNDWSELERHFPTAFKELIKKALFCEENFLRSQNYHNKLIKARLQQIETLKDSGKIIDVSNNINTSYFELNDWREYEQKHPNAFIWIIKHALNREREFLVQTRAKVGRPQKRLFELDQRYIRLFQCGLHNG